MCYLQKTSQTNQTKHRKNHPPPKKKPEKNNKTPFDLSVTWHLIKDGNPDSLVLSGSYQQVRWVLQCNLFLRVLVKTKRGVAEGPKGKLSVLECLYKLKKLSIGLTCEILCCRKISGTSWFTVNKSVTETLAHKLISCYQMWISEAPLTFLELHGFVC